MGVFHDRYPAELRAVVSHAERLTKSLSEMEQNAGRAGAWVVGRATEVPAVLRGAIQDWRDQKRDTRATRDEIAAYLDGVHGSAARLGGLVLGCCKQDEAITSPGGEWGENVTSWNDTARTATRVHTGAATVRGAGSLGGPEVMQRFHEELYRVELSAAGLARRLRITTVSIEDLQAFGREGLLDAARSYNPAASGVPFSQWAFFRVRQAMLDGIRSWGHVPPRLWQELRIIEHEVDCEPGSAQASRRGELHAHVGTIQSADVIGTAEDSSLGRTPETPASRAETSRELREVIASLPPSERELLEQHYFQGATLEEAARAIGLSKSGASRMHTRTVKLVQQEMRRRGFDWSK